MTFIDAHCHLEAQTYGDELPAVLARARAAGVQQCIAVGASDVCAGADEAVALAAANANIFAAVGIHPLDAGAADPSAMQRIERALAMPRVVCLGEVGLDYVHGAAPRQVQCDVFARFLRMAERTQQPIMLHIREAHDDAWRVIDEVGMPARGGMVHCFTAGAVEAEQYLRRGFYLSIPGVVTFKNAATLREVLPFIPPDRLLLETDSPFLAPVPYRGKRNEPSFLPATAAALAQALSWPLAKVAATCTANTRRFFNI